MTSPPQVEILLIGVGNLLRGDDAAGKLAAKLVRARNHPSIRVLEHDGEGASLIEIWSGARHVIVVDAVSSDSPPGTIIGFDATQQPLPERVFHNSTHAFGLHEAVELSRALKRLPHQLIIYGIVGESFDVGAGLSPKVEEAVRQVVKSIFRELGVGV